MLSIKELRELTGLSQDKFAKEYHLSSPTLRRWEQGVTQTPEHYLYSMNELFKYKGYFYDNSQKQ
jgi:DNA-binding transcriptional regulator YiaG